jgi:hypothetical protein
LTDHLIARGAQLQRVVSGLEQLQDLLLLSGAGPEAKRLLKVVQPVVRMMRSSGILREEIHAWLKSLRAAPDQDALQDLCEMELMQNELYWQVRKANRMLREFREHGVAKVSAADQQRLAQIGEDLSAAVTPRQ